jgi:DnaJ-class molecular chaperone
MTNLTYYDVLQIGMDADDTALRQAYIRMVKRYHPDMVRGQNPQLIAARFHLIQEAYETLCDPGKRRAYNQGLSMQRWQAGAPENDNTHPASDVFTRARTTIERLMRLMSETRHVRVQK